MYRFARCYLLCLLSTAAIIYGTDDPSSHIVSPGYDWKVLRKREFTSNTNPLSQSSPNLYTGKQSTPKQVKIHSREKSLSESEEKVRAQSSKKASDKQVRFSSPSSSEESSSEEDGEDEE